jgi:hypothetical protein
MNTAALLGAMDAICLQYGYQPAQNFDIANDGSVWGIDGYVLAIDGDKVTGMQAEQVCDQEMVLKLDIASAGLPADWQEVMKKLVADCRNIRKDLVTVDAAGTRHFTLESRTSIGFQVISAPETTFSMKKGGVIVASTKLTVHYRE